MHGERGPIPIPSNPVQEPGDEIIGKLVKITNCRAEKHGENDSCICDLIGKTVKIDSKHQRAFQYLPSIYRISGSNKLVSRSEVELLKQWSPVRFLKDEDSFILFILYASLLILFSFFSAQTSKNSYWRFSTIWLLLKIALDTDVLTGNR